MTDPITTSIIAASMAYVAKPVAEEFLKKMSGPLAEELGQVVANPLREWRARRAAAAIERSVEMLESADITPEPVAPKILIPLLEAASLEGDDSLTEQWSSLLANAAAGERGAPVHPRFIAVLQQMTPSEAAMLQALRDLGSLTPDLWNGNPIFRFIIPVPPEEMPNAVDALISLGLAQRDSLVGPDEDGSLTIFKPTEVPVRFTEFGKRFFAAVTPPGETRGA